MVDSATRPEAEIAVAAGRPLRRLDGTSVAVWSIAVCAWVALASLAVSGHAELIGHDPPVESVLGRVGALGAFLLGWTIMALAMMLPTTTALLRAVARLRPGERGRGARAASAAGFVGVWAVVGYAFRAGDVMVHALVDSSGWLGNNDHLLAAGALATAGAFQFSDLKHHCLTACRAPTGFIYRNLRGGRPSADLLRVGAAYGMSCAGCCWALMLVMFAVGMANVAWMLAIGMTMAVEKNTAWGRRATAPIGVALLTAAVAVAVAG